MSRPLRLFLKVHRFEWTGIKLGFWLGRRSQRLFYQLRGLMVTFDVLLTLLFYLSLVATLVALLTIPWSRTVIPAAVLLTVDALFVWLLLFEAREHRFHRLKPFSIYNIDVGSARVLRGRIALWHVFVARSQTQWRKRRVDEVMKRIAVATDWLTAQARRYEVDVRFESRIVSTFVKWSAPIPQHGNGYQNLESFRRRVIFASLRSDADTIGRDGIGLLCHVTDDIRCYAIPARFDEEDDGGFEFAVIDRGAAPEIIAHEILHLFGADDYYLSKLSMERIAKEQLIERSIMFLATTLPFEDLTVDELTAQNIGWR